MAELAVPGVGGGSAMLERDWWRDRATDAGVVAGRAVLAYQGGVGWIATLKTPGRASTRRGGDLGVRRQGAAGLNPALGQRAETGRLGPSHQTRAGNLALRIALTQTHQGLAALIPLDALAGPQLSPAKPGRGNGGPRKVETSV